MTVRDIMITDIEFIRATDTVKQAAEKMRLYDIGAMPVSDNGEIVGIITDRDIVVRAVANGADPMAVKVGRIMTPGLIACTDDTDANNAAALMETHHVHRLLVKNGRGLMVGLITLSDLALSLSPNAFGSLMRGIYGRSTPAPPG